jgi:hypothetical protein
MGLFDMDETRPWNGRRDEINDQRVNEVAVPQETIDRNNTVDAVPGCRWRPGSRN